MLLKVTLQRTGVADGQDLLIDADPTATVGALSLALAERDPARTGDVAQGTLAVVAPEGPRGLDPAVTLADAALQSGDRITVKADGGRFLDGADQRAPAATLVVREGPDKGQRFSLRPGANQAGRDRHSDLILTDPMASKRHARFNVTDVVEVLDLGSVNGVFVDGEPVDRAILRPGDRVLLGDTLLAVETIRRSVGAEEITGPTVAFNRSPYLDPVYLGQKIKAPEPPGIPNPQRFPAIAMVAPLLFGIIMYVFTRQLISVIFMALSPVMLIGTWVEGKRSSRQAIAEARVQFGAALDGLEARLTRVQAEEVARRRLEQPPAAQVLAAAGARAPMLWARRPDRHSFLTMRLGLGCLPSRSEVELPQSNNAIPELWDDLLEVVARHQYVDDVPVTATLPDVGVVGVAGSLDDALGAARSVLVQVAGLHSPAEVAIAGLFSPDAAGHWDWLKWLPHTTSEHAPIEGPLLVSGAQACNALVASIRDLIDQRSGEAGPKKADEDEAPVPVPAVVVVIDDAAPVERSLLVELAERGPAAGVCFVWVAPTVDALPAAATAFLAHDAATHHATAGFISTGRAVTPVASEPVSGPDALAFARSLAPVVDAGARPDELGALPARVSFAEEVGVELLHEPGAVVDRWRLSGSLPNPAEAVKKRRKATPLQAIVGMTTHGPLQLDLRAHGPHALVGGTTGAGKSEFLQSWILGLAANHSPNRVTFLFVDYKGGAAFAECVKLPHTVGLVTDLTPHLVQRALASLNAELRYREGILNRKKVKDVLELEKLQDPETPPSLVIVVDEFAALVAEVPEFVDGVVNVAQRGRSLGLHLILATQRPAGVIKDNLRANTNLRVALRMADEGDSSDVVGTDLAAGFDPAIPGRAVAKLGPGRLNPFQAAYLGGWTTGVAPPPRIVISSNTVGSVTEWPEPETEAVEDEDLGPNDLERIVESVSSASVTAGLAPPRKPWLAELAATYDLARPMQSDADVRLLSRTDERLIFGVLDDPANQAQTSVAFEPDRDGNMAVIGTGGSGKSTFLRTLAVAASLSTRGGPCHVYGLDFASRGLDMLSGLPNVGAVITGDDEERTTRVLGMLRGVIDERLARYAAAKADTITQYRRVASRPDEARILLLVDGFPAFRQEYEGSSRLRTYDLFQSIATDGRQAGVHVVIAADRSGAIPSALSSVIQRWLMLRLANENEYSLSGVPADVFPPGTPPGRGWYQDREVQVAVLSGSANAADQARTTTRLAKAAVERGMVPAPEVGALPESMPLGNLPDQVDGRAVIGVGDDALGPFGVPLEDPIVVVGPPKSGKTTALLTMLHAVVRCHGDVPLTYLGDGRSALAGVNWGAQIQPGPEVREVLDKAIAEWEGVVPSDHSPTGVVVIDDVPKVAAWAEADRVGDLVTCVLAAGGVVLADGEASAMTGTYGLQQTLKVARTGLVLVPDQYDGENIFKTPLPKINRAAFPPGRGFFLHAGRAHKLQVAQPSLSRQPA